MPIIPYVEEGQRLTPGSPVPVGGERESRMPADAVANMGQALFTLGDALDVADKRARAQREKLEEMEAFTEFRKVQELAFANAHEADLIEDDPAGTKAIGAYREVLDGPLNEISGKISDEKVRRSFLVRAKGLISDSAMRVWAAEVVKREKDNERRRGKIISNILDSAKDNPENMTEYLGEISALIESDVGIPRAAKKIMESEAHKGVTRGVIQEQIKKGQISGKSAHFDRALVILDQNGKGVFDDVERNKISDDIFNERGKTLERMAKKKDYLQKQYGEMLKKEETKILQTAHELLMQAGNSDALREPVINYLNAQVYTQSYSAEFGTKALSLIQNRAPMEASDDRYEAELMAKALNGKVSFKDAMLKVERDMGKPIDGVSMDRASKLLQDLRRWETHERSSPESRDLYRRGISLLENLKDKAPLDLARRLKGSSEHDIKVDRVIGIYIKSMSKNPAQDPMSVALSLKNKYFSATPSLKTKTSPSALSTPKDTHRAALSIAKKMAKEKQLGTLTKERRLEYLKEMDELKRHLKTQEEPRFLNTPIIKDDKKAPGKGGAAGGVGS